MQMRKLMIAAMMLAAVSLSVNAAKKDKTEPAESRANILTINQNIPINGLADISISIETVSMYGTVDDIINDISKLAGVRKCMILSRE